MTNPINRPRENDDERQRRDEDEKGQADTVLQRRAAAPNDVERPAPPAPSIVPAQPAAPPTKGTDTNV